MELLCVWCGKTFRTRRRGLDKLECPYCHKRLVAAQVGKYNIFVAVSDRMVRT